MKAIIAESKGNLDDAERAAAEQHVDVDDDGKELPKTPNKPRKTKRSSQQPDIEALEKRAKESGELVELLRSQILPAEPVNNRTTFSAYVKSTLMGLGDSDFRRARKGINKVLAPFIEASSSEDDLPSITSRQPSATVSSISPANSFQQVQQGGPFNSGVWNQSQSWSHGPSEAWQPPPSQWRAPPPAPTSVWKSQDPAYMQQYYKQPSIPVAMSRMPSPIPSTSKVTSEKPNIGDTSLPDLNSSLLRDLIPEFDQDKDKK